MNIAFDPKKDAINQIAHGISLELAAQLDWDTLQSKPDTRRDYGELRNIGYAIMDSRLYCVVYVDRDDVRRVISLRKANDREVTKYAKNY
jgi:uncharacterized protein